MALRNNKASQLNRYMMFGMFFLAFVVFGCVFAFLYLSTNKDSNPLVENPSEKGQVDSTLVLEIIGDSSLVDSLLD